MTADSSTPAPGAGACEGLPPWLRGIWAQLAPALAAGRLPHALLLAGPEGLGKMAFAQALGEALLCESPRPDHHACGHCRACRLLAAGSHPDLHVVAPAEEGKAIRVDAIRELIGFAALTPQFGGRRVLRLAPAELLNVNAANALLKTLEEPAPGSHLILVSSRPARLLPTVRSRCQTIRFAPPPVAEARAWLAPRCGEADAALLLALAAGSPLRALALAGALERRRELFRAFLDLAAGKLDAVRAAERFLAGGAPAEVAGWLAGWHHDLLRLTMAAGSAPLTNPDYAAPLATLAARVAPQWLVLRWDAVLALRARLATPLNAQLAFEDFFIDWAGAAARRG